MEYGGQALEYFGRSASQQIESSLDELRESSIATEVELTKSRLDVVQGAIAALPAPLA